ncbi:phosphatase PAP2 family protein [Mycolicibacterium sp. 018/SC-01/001]|uniref:phosphatase PAP2 family protein n=1 Tax=Mycolicibacterium sp. 018/SC-01/001 TaxID=2592069 RepID=UPI00117D890F|nr:phosphatase PAP2 family protein [Mycolicibacterium sp. 018/SC-01/001]TRW88312.1 phosphatase PAP2 family protein [Mycolicibacterium sp. 018/SC-01/001]
MNTLDHSLFLHINDFARSTGWLHPVVVGWATYGIAIFAVLMLLGWWRARRRDDPTAMAAALWAPLATVIAVTLNQPVAALVAEPRPYTSLPGILVLAHQSTDPSFPSDHAVAAGAAAVSLFVVDLAIGSIAAVAAVLMAFARVYIAAHYPGDVVAGLALGIAVALVGWALVRRPLVTLVERLRQSRLHTLTSAHRRREAS